MRMSDIFNQPKKEIGELIPKDLIIQEYKNHQLRTAHLEDGTEVWVVTDVIGAVIQPKNPRNYWTVTKRKLIAEGWDEVTKIHLMYVKDSLGRDQLTQVMTRPQILRMLQSLPSKKAEPFKQWIAKLANERIEEIQNPDLAVKRGVEGYIKKGMTPKQAEIRAKGVIVRKTLTDKWATHGINSRREFALLTDRVSKGTFSKTTSQMKKDKNLAPYQKLRDKMNIQELTAQMVSETAISLLIDKNNPMGFKSNAKEVDKGSSVGRRMLEDLNRVLKM